MNSHRTSYLRPIWRFCLAALALVAAATAAAQGAGDAPDLSQLQWRGIGPGGIGGRIVDFAVVEADTDTFYVATAQSGVWKTVNGGLTWAPVFDDQPRQSIGGIAVAPTNPNVIWVGTGESNGRNLVSTSWGDGAYKSEDGGKSWRHMGLEDSLHIGRIHIDPRDENVVFVPVVGALVHDNDTYNEARGLFRTRDGGETWEKVLSAGPFAGFVDIAADPTRPDILYATAWDRERKDWSWLPTGDDGGVWRSNDGGDTWTQLGGGLPTTDIGRIGVSVCPSRPDRVYLNVEGPEGGVFRSDDRGASWERTNPDLGASMYYAQIRCDPNDPERVYVLSTSFNVSHDGGRTFTNEMQGHPVHVDHHALWIDPADSDHLLLGNDGGVYLSRDRGASWRFADNLPITQFYEIGADDLQPFYRVYGGTQDNNSIGGPSATRNRAGITNDDWFLTVGGDGFYTRPDPVDPGIVYTESQFGFLTRFDAHTGERKPIRPADPPDCVDLDDEDAPADAPRCYRWNWSAPIQISQHDHNTLYFAANVVFRSRDRGDSWEVISDDLTRMISYENPMNDYGTIRVIAESPHRAGVLLVGTDDGLIHVTEDDGATWRRTESLPGVPERALVRRLVISAHDPRVVYAVSSAHEYYDFTPYVLRSDDLGASWQSIRGNLPDGSPLRAFAEDPDVPGLLFAGTEHGIWTSLDDGASWHSLQNNMPNVAIHDLLVQPRAHDLIAGTHGRGIWILDDIGSLETMAATPAGSWLSPPRRAVLGHRFDRGRYFRGDTYFTAPNPPSGLLIDLHVDPAELERPDGADEDWRVPEPALRVLDANGNLVRRLDPPGSGTHRIEWDLRYDPAWTSPDGDGQVQSPRVMPGEYVVELRVGDTVLTQQAQVVLDPILPVSAPDLRLWHDTQRELAGLLATQRTLRDMSSGFDERISAAEAAVKSAGVDDAELAATIAAAREAVDKLVEDVREIGGTVGRAYGQMQGSFSRPTADQLALAERAGAELTKLADGANQLLGDTLPALDAALDAAGVPWTPGRRIHDES